MDEIECIKQQINQFHKEWDDTGDDYDGFKHAENIESKVINLIVDYCQKKGFKPEGLTWESEYANDDFEEEILQRYIDTFTTTHDDVAELMWHYHNTFWPDFYENKQSFIQNILEP